MPRFRFELISRGSSIDSQVIDAPDWPAAKREALRFLGAMLIAHPKDLHDRERWRIDISDATGKTSYSIDLHLKRADETSLPVSLV